MRESKQIEANLDLLKAWAHWAELNPIDDDQLQMARSVNFLFHMLDEARTLAASWDNNQKDAKNFVAKVDRELFKL